jgi:hypothetical protein
MHNNNIKTKIIFPMNFEGECQPSIDLLLHTVPDVNERIRVKGMLYGVKNRELLIVELMEGSMSLGFQQRCELTLKF